MPNIQMHRPYINISTFINQKPKKKERDKNKNKIFTKKKNIYQNHEFPLQQLR